ncbi:MAG: DUF3300 domain-containing protein [Acidobacteriia bacterium]|nr:DUF3300 domain-containing protein [Terriglobia bacterium]
MQINFKQAGALFLGSIFAACLAVAPVLAQGQYPPPQAQYPPPQGQYPPPQAQYPPPQGQYPPAQYPPSQGQYPPPQAAYGPPPVLAPAQLDRLVAPIALYPDGLLAQVLTASTYYNEIPEAAGWSNQHSYITGPALAQAIQQDNLPWDPSVLALLPFPSVLNQLANNMGWAQELGNAVLAQRGDVMDAVQRMRRRAYDYGYLRTNQYVRVVPAGPGYVEILSVQPDYYYVPFYDPLVVFARPRPGFFVGGAIRFGPGIVIGAAFSRWGWAGPGFGWREHTILIDRRPWERTWVNRSAYVHPYAVPYWRYEGTRVERHELRGPEHYDRGEHRNEEHGRDGRPDRR